MGKRPSPALIGGFVVGAVALVVLAIVTFGSGTFFRTTTSYVLFFQGTVSGLEIGAPVKFRGVTIGAVTKIVLRIPNYDADNRIPVFIEVDQDRTVELGAVGDLANRSQELIDRGLRAQLSLQSIITGVLYVALDIFPNSPVELMLPANSGYREIPTLPTTLEQAQQKIQDILEKLSKVDFDRFLTQLNGALESVSGLASSEDLHAAIAAARDALKEARALIASAKPRLDGALAGVQGSTDDLRAAMKRLDATLESLQTLSDTNGPLVNGFTGTLEDLGEAARAVHDLADYLTRNPNALLTGRSRP
jgi:paraquat-inducible protein B